MNLATQVTCPIFFTFSEMFKEFDAEKQFRVSMEDLKATFDVMK